MDEFRRSDVQDSHDRYANVEPGSPSLLDLIRALISSADDRQSFVDGPHRFLGDRGLSGITRGDVRDAGTALEIDAPEAPDAAVTLPAADADGLDGAIAEIEGLLVTALPDDPIVSPPVAPDDPESAAPEAEPEAPTFLDNLEPAGEHFEDALDEISGDEGGLTNAIRDVVDYLSETGDAIGEEADEAQEDFAEGDIAAGTLGILAGGMLAPVGEAADTMIDAAGDLAGGAISATGEVVSGVVSGLVGLTGNETAMNAVEEGLADFNEGVDTAAGYVEQGFDYLGDGVGAVVEGVGEVAEGVGEVIDEGIEAVGDAAEEVGDWLGL